MGECLEVCTTTLKVFLCGGVVNVYEFITVTNEQLDYKDYWECTETAD